jgi:probable F420-dependent oxidoreductase
VALAGPWSDEQVKVRIGVSLGTGAEGATGFAAAVDRLEQLGIDSLWLSELVYSDSVEPFIGMAFALSRTSRLKVGTGVAVLPGRHPVLVAKQLTSLAALAPRRVLPVFGLQPARRHELDAFPLPPARDGSDSKVRRGDVFDESLALLTRLLREEQVTWESQTLSVRDAQVGPRPAKPLDVWLGGSAPAGLRRIGRLADGWLGSFLSPVEAGEARRTIEAEAAAAGRTVDPEHFGMSLPVALGELPAALLALIQDRRPDVDPADLIAQGWAGCQELVRRYVEVGISKFVIRSASPETSQEAFLTGFTHFMSPLQT